jgi:hypothetical protein
MGNFKQTVQVNQFLILDVIKCMVMLTSIVNVLVLANKEDARTAFVTIYAHHVCGRRHVHNDPYTVKKP